MWFTHFVILIEDYGRFIRYHGGHPHFMQGPWLFIFSITVMLISGYRAICTLCFLNHPIFFGSAQRISRTKIREVSSGENPWTPFSSCSSVKKQQICTFLNCLKQSSRSNTFLGNRPLLHLSLKKQCMSPRANTNIWTNNHLCMYHVTLVGLNQNC